MSESSTPKKDGYVYKRRKLHSNSVALLSEHDAQEKIMGSAGENPTRSSECYMKSSKMDDRERAPGISADECARIISSNGNASISAQPQPQKPVVFVIALPANGFANLDSAETAVTRVQSYTNKSCSLSRYYRAPRSALVKSELVDTRECSSSDGMVVEPLGDPSTKGLCISMLGENGLLGRGWSTSACTTAELLNGNVDAKFSQSCRICKLWGNPLKMLICDLCEEAFHLSCCKPKLKKVPVDEWYCQTCFRKRPKPSVEMNAGKPFKYIKNEEHRKRMLQGVGPIESMLKDVHPYVSRVRIGYDFQAEIPDWSGPISDDCNCFGEVSELDPAECASLQVWHFNKPSKPSSIGNWIQCREMIYSDTDDSDEGVICGKWRRAPLFISQTEYWDCSCAVIWDPVHADCAVPQELETNEVLKHLKYLQLLKPRLAIRKENHIQTKRDGCEQLGGTKNIHPLN